MRDESRQYHSTATALQECTYADRAIAIWPYLDASDLQGLGCDSGRIAAYVAVRTNLSVDEARDMLARSSGAESEMLLFFG